MNMPVKVDPQSGVVDRSDYYARIARERFAPLWEHLHDLVTPTPRTSAVPAHWDYDNVARALLVEAGDIISARDAERRVLVLENPNLPGSASVTRSLFAGLQILFPGEIAIAHRHTQSALRFILEGEGAFTTVGGERIFMRPGDLILTPNWNWHDHGNDTDQPIVWLDGLDLPTVNFFDGAFAAYPDTDQQTLTRPSGDGLARFGANLAPLDWRPQAKASPVFSYPYDRSLAVLDAMRQADKADAHHGWKMRFVNPATGGHVMATLGAFIQRLEPGRATAPWRTTESTVYVVAEGEGYSTIGDRTFRWKPRDIFVAPSWAWQSHQPDGDAVLFSYSNRPVMEALDLFREERG